MKQLFHTLFLCGSLLALASCGTDDLLPTPNADGNTPGEPEARPLISITASLGANTTSGTRTGHEETPDAGIKVSWAEDDQFVIHSLDADGKSIGSTTFTLAKGDAGKESATFKGEEPIKGTSYLICYPANVTIDKETNSVYLVLSGQKQMDDKSMAHLSKFDPMLGHTVKAGDFSQISFTPDDATHKESGHRAALMTFNLTNIPTELGTPKRIVLSTAGGNKCFGIYAHFNGEPLIEATSAALDLENVNATQGSITAYLMVTPTTIAAGEKLTITLEGSQKSYMFTSPGMPAGGVTYKRGMRYKAAVDMATATPIIAYDDTAPASGTYSTGKGEKDEPFLVSTSGDLKKLIEDTDTADKYFKLACDITLPEGKAWTPIGSTDKPFKGHFDGDGRTISGEMKSETTELGFFGKIEGATITNLHTSAKVITTLPETNGDSTTGAIVGDASNSTISNCTNTGEVLGAALVGGIVGYNEGCTLINCINTGAVKSQNSASNVQGVAGGIGSLSDNSTIVGCANTGSVHAMFAGGIVGSPQTTAVICGCFNTGLITSVDGDSFGAIIGSNATDVLDLSHCQYVHAATQSAGLTACGHTVDSSADKVARCADIAALNNTGITVLNEGIAAWLTANPGKVCNLFKAGKDDNTPPAIALK